jgi:hypothetical protein
MRMPVDQQLVIEQTTGEIDTGRPDELIIDTMLALMMGLQINALFSPQHNTPERQMAMLDDFFDGLHSRHITS